VYFHTDHLTIGTVIGSYKGTVNFWPGYYPPCIGLDTTYKYSSYASEADKTPEIVLPRVNRARQSTLPATKALVREAWYHPWQGPDLVRRYSLVFHQCLTFHFRTLPQLGQRR